MNRNLERVAYPVLWTVFIATAATIVALSIYQPRLVGFGCDVGQGPTELRTLYANAEDDFPVCQRIELY